MRLSSPGPSTEAFSQSTPLNPSGSKTDYLTMSERHSITPKEVVVNESSLELQEPTQRDVEPEKKPKAPWWSYIWDYENRKYLDFTAGIAVNSLGHCDPEISNIIASQVRPANHHQYHTPPI